MTSPTQTVLSWARIAGAALWGSMLVSTGADTIELRGGRTLDGVIIKETEEVLVLDIGMGEMSFPHDQVVAIKRSSDADNHSTRKAWDLRYISEPDLPKPLRTVYRDWDRLQAVRKRATAGVRSLDGTVREQTRLQTAIRNARAEYTALSQDLADTPMERDIVAYNAKVERNNELVAQLSRHQAALTAGEDRQQRIREDMSRYARNLTEFERKFEEASAPYVSTDTDAVARAWVDRTATALADMNADFSRSSIPVSGPTGGTLLDVRLNGTDTGRFILDTGASVVTLSETMARRLNLRYDSSQPVLLRLADGKTSEGYPAVLNSVAVGDARAEGVGAVVLPHEPAPGVDGLLGMSFLSRFEMSFDPTGNRLELRKLQAR